jgi:hypothetical protein
MTTGRMQPRVALVVDRHLALAVIAAMAIPPTLLNRHRRALSKQATGATMAGN